MTADPITIWLAPNYDLQSGVHYVSGLLQIGTDVVLRFNFSRDDANERCRRLRQAAREWVDSVSYDVAKEDERWKQLNECSVTLFKFIFAIDLPRAQRIFQSARKNARILILQNIVELEVPWGMLCSPDDLHSSISENRSPVFWGAKYDLQVSLTSSGNPSGRREDEWYFSPLLCRPTFQDNVKALPEQAVVLAASINQRSLDPLNTIPEKAESQPNCFFFVHSHADTVDGMLEFQNEDGQGHYLDLLDLLLHGPFVSDGVLVAVINGCETVENAWKMGRSLAFSMGNFETATIVTEVPVSNKFAINFGLELVDRCVQKGQSTVTAVTEMRQKHYPLSIIYAHYCLAELIVKPPISLIDDAAAEAYRSGIEGVNYSNTFYQDN